MFTNLCVDALDLVLIRPKLWARTQLKTRTSLIKKTMLQISRLSVWLGVAQCNRNIRLLTLVCVCYITRLALT